MEYQVWARDKLIEEIKRERKEQIKQATREPLTNWKLTQTYSDEILSKMIDTQLRAIYVQFKTVNDPKFKEEYEADQESKRFFNQPECDADYDYWSKQACWKIDEGIALILGKDPRKVTWANIQKYTPQSLFTRKFVELRELAFRYVSFQQLYECTPPGNFLAWAERLDISYPAELKTIINKLGIQIADWKSLYEGMKEQNEHLVNRCLKLVENNKNLEQNQAPLTKQPEKSDQDDLGEKERISLYILVATMAYNGYGHDPQQKKSPTPAELSKDALKTLGENISDDTARKWLKLATDRFPKIDKNE